MNFFITGGSGFIGSILANKLLASGKSVTVYDNFSRGKKKFLDNKSNKLKIIRGDIRNYRLLKKSIKNHDFVFHLAANSDIPAGIKNSRLDFTINTLGTLNLLDCMVHNNIKNLVFASSSAVFGFPNKFPTPEEYGPCLPESFYGASKLSAEGFVAAFSHIHNIKSWIFRFANVTGSPATHGIIYDFTKKLHNNSKNLVVLGNGHQEKSYITNEMLVDCMLHVIKKTKQRKQKLFLYNIGNFDTIKVSQIAKLFLKEKNSSKRIQYVGGVGGWKGDVHKMRLDINKVIKEGWKPSMNSRDCIKHAINNYWN